MLNRNKLTDRKDDAAALYKSLHTPIPQNYVTEKPIYPSMGDYRQGLLRDFSDEESQKSQTSAHDSTVPEIRSDIMALRYMASKNKIWDASKSKVDSFTPEMLNQLYKVKELNTPQMKMDRYGPTYSQPSKESKKKGNLDKVGAPNDPGLILERLRSRYNDSDLLYLMNRVAKNENATPLDQAQNGAWLDKYDVPQAQGGYSTGDIASLPGVRKDIPLSKEQLAKNKKEVEERIKVKNAKTLADRKARLAGAEKANAKPYSSIKSFTQQLADETQATGDKFRLFPNDPNSVIDDYLNPGVFIGNLASGVGRVPLNIQQGNYGEAALNLAAPAVAGATEALLEPVLKTAGKFLTEETALKNAYKLNPYAFKPNPEAVYRQIGEPGYRNAIQEGKVLAKGQKEFLEKNPGFNYWDEYNKFMDFSKKTGLNLEKPKVAPFFQKGELFFPISNKTGFGRGKTTASDVKYLLEGKLPEEAIVPRYRDQYLTNEVFNRNATGGTGVLDPKYSDLSNFDVYQKHWLQGYKKIPKKKKEKGGIVKDDNGYWNPDNWGKPVEIGSNDITMQGVNEPLLGVSDEGDTKMMHPGEDYKFKGKKVTEYPVKKNWLEKYK